MFENKLANLHKVHFIGIGGAGMSALAHVLLKRNYEVRGSDLNSNRISARLAEEGATVYMGHEASQLEDADCVVVSTAIHAENCELVEAKNQGIPVLHRSDILAALINADGADVSIVSICLKDANGRVVPDACKQLTLKTEGNVKILGVGNGDPACHDPERPADINTHDFSVKSFNGYAQVLIQSQKTAGKASLTVSGEGIKAAKLAFVLK